MSDEKSGCFGWIMALFGRFMALFRIKPHDSAGKEPATSTQSAQPAEPSAPPLELLQQKPPPSAAIEVFPYKINRSLLLPSEFVFYRVLVSVVGKRALICPKVRLGDVFFVVDFKENLPHYFRIAEKHVDFLLCDPQTIKPIVGIELNDEGHRQNDRKERDKFIGRVFEAAGLPLVPIPVQPRYHSHELAKRLAPYLGEEAEPQVSSGPEQ